MPRANRIIALDTETTGVDFYHGSRPFLVTIAKPGDVNICWEWPVDPMTRRPIVPRFDLQEIQGELDDADVVVLQNAGFDVRGLRLSFWDAGLELRWEWPKVVDTLMGGHLLASDQPHDLTSMAMVYLGVNVQPLEDDLKAACMEARKMVRDRYPRWMIAEEGLPSMPSVKPDSRRGEEKPWKVDQWLPLAVACKNGYPQDHPWRSLCREYANGDSTTTLYLWARQEDLMKQRGLMEIYRARLEVLPSIEQIEGSGITCHAGRVRELKKSYQESSASRKRACLSLAGGAIDELPKNGVSNVLKSVLFDQFSLKSPKKTKKGNVSLDQSVLDGWLASLPPRSKPYKFIENLLAYRKRQTALSFIQSYEKFWLPAKGEYRVIYSRLNPTGTHTLRFSSQNPNSQQISQQEIAESDGEEHSARYMFGPMPGREWWSLDYQNLELRIPSYAAGEEAAIDVFEHPDRPPFFGSYHLLVCSALHPRMFQECLDHGESFKTKYEHTWYKWVKSGNFAVIYGAQESTADGTYRVRGAYKIIRRQFPRIAALSDAQLELARKNGYVETMPDRTVDPKRGYPLRCRGGRWGVSPTVPLNYFVQGTAMWLTMQAMTRCHRFLEEYNRKRPAAARAWMTMQVHDEIVFDFPCSRVAPVPGMVKNDQSRTNFPAIKEIKSLMEKGGSDVGVPTPVSVTYHPRTWSEGIKI